MDESIRNEVLDFVGRRPVILASIASRASGDYPVLHQNLLDHGIDVREFSFERDPQKNYDGSSPPLAGRKVLVVDTGLVSDDYFFIAKRLARANAFDFRYLTENPPKLHSVNELFLEAYQRGTEMSSQDLGADVQRFVEKYPKVIGTDFHVTATQESRRFGLGIALAVNNQRRDVYTDSLDQGCLIVYLDKRKNPRIRRSDRKRKIFLIEDDGDSTKILKNMISGQNNLYIVEDFRDAEKGFEKLKADRPDIVVTDFMMPKVNGLEIAAEAIGLNISVILLTAYPDRYASREAQKLGVRYLFNKPYEPEKLIDAIEDLTWDTGAVGQN